MDAATTRTIRIGTADIGLVGLDIALNKAAAENLPEDEAVAFLFSAVSTKNYIPAGAEDNYREALRKAYRQHLDIDPPPATGLVIRIFGTGCISCDRLQGQVIELLDHLGLAADIEQIHDPDEIGRRGILVTPALMINGRVKSGGKPPTPAQIEQWIREAAGHG
jgi:hypothetical protein